MTTHALRPKSEGIRVEINRGRKTVAATFAEFHLSVVQAVEVGKARGGGKPIEKITGMNKATDVTMKRGVVHDQSFSDWLNDIRSGKCKNCSVVVTVPMKARGKSVLRCKLGNVQISKYDSPALSGKGNDVAIEELVLSSEKVELA